MLRIKNFVTSFLREQTGISSVEYALMLAFMGGAIVLGATVLGDSVGAKLSTAADCINNVAGACDSL